MKTKKSILISLFTLALMVLGLGVVKAAGVGVQSYETVCLDGDKTTAITEKNGQTLCYVVGRLGTSGGASAGFISQAYSGDGLKIIGTEKHVDGSGTIWVNAGTNSSSSPSITTNDSKAPEGLKSSACPAAKFLTATKGDSDLKGIESAGCGVFYTPTSEASFLFTKSGMADSSKKIISDSMSKMADYGVVGAYKVQITAEEGSGCGQICVQTIEIEDNTQWTCVVEREDGTYKTTDDKDCGPKTMKSTQFCTEVHYNITKEVKPTPEPGPPTGAFASYTILAAGALIAISAITIAKKHNKISKI